jgi:hypothetical protein
MQNDQSNGCASFDSIPGIFETIRIIPNVAALPRGRAEMCCPFIGTCRNVGSNLGSHLRHDSYREIGEGNASSSGSVGTLNPRDCREGWNRNGECS